MGRGNDRQPRPHLGRPPRLPETGDRMTETDEQYAARQNFEVRRDTILGILGVLDVDQVFVEAIMPVPTLGAGEIPKANPIDWQARLDEVTDAILEEAIDG